MARSKVINNRQSTMSKLVIIFGFLWAVAAAQNYQTTPVPILKQINRHNDDGSYSYGYEGADGTFKIETKYPTGEVYGKYGYVDDTGKVREIEYGASRRGFEPAGTGINVPPPTLSQSQSDNSLDYDDGQYREDPTKYYNKRPLKTLSRTFSNPRFQTQVQHTPALTAPPPAPAPQYYEPPQQRYYNPAPASVNYDHNLFRGHPANNFDVATGSYSISYSG